MVSKSIDKIYVEPFLASAGVSFNTNDSMVASGNVNGDVIVRNLLNPDGSPTQKDLNLASAAHDVGISQVTLTHQTQGRSELTQVKFSVVKRNVLASAYKNGQIVIWDTNGIFTKPQ